MGKYGGRNIEDISSGYGTVINILTKTSQSYSEKITEPSAQLHLGEVVSQSHDLWLAAGVAMILPGLILFSIPILRIPLGVIQALFLPGYLMTLILFPKMTDLSLVARLAFSVGISAAMLPILALVLNELPWGIRTWPIVISLSGITLCLAGIVVWRRQNLSSQIEFYNPRFSKDIKNRNMGNLATRKLNAVLFVCFFVVFFMFLAGIFRPAELVTEFYLLGPEGRVENYPRQVEVGENISIRMGINHQAKEAETYWVEAQLIDDTNAKQGWLISKSNRLTLKSMEIHEWMFEWSMPVAGADQQVEFVLYRERDHEPFRRTRLWLDVSDVK